ITTAPDATSTYYVVPQAVLDLDGAFDCQLDHFTIKGGSSNTQYVRHGLYYHWLGSVSAASSSRLKATNVQVTGVTLDSAFQLGGSDAAELNQADMVGLFFFFKQKTAYEMCGGLLARERSHEAVTIDRVVR